MVTEVIRYAATDGAEFTTLAQAKEHEANLGLVSTLRDYVNRLVADGLCTEDSNSTTCWYVNDLVRALLNTAPELRKILAGQAIEPSQLELDAQRYRKLRSLHWSGGSIAVVPDPRHAVRLWGETLYEENLDAALDKLPEVSQ